MKFLKVKTTECIICHIKYDRLPFNIMINKNDLTFKCLCGTTVILDLVKSEIKPEFEKVKRFLNE